MGKKYIGDGAYVEFEGENTILTTSNGIEDTNRIVLEPQVMAALLIWATHHRARVLEERKKAEG